MAIWEQGKFPVTEEAPGATTPDEQRAVTKNWGVNGSNKLEDGSADAHQNIIGAGSSDHAAIDSHLGSSANPHAVTKTQVGLEDVSNDLQIPAAAFGVANGVATLDGGSKVPVAQLDLSNVLGNVGINVANAFYLGDSTVDGTWRLIVVGGNLEIQKRESGTYVSKSSLS